jgi:hypothetical protein
LGLDKISQGAIICENETAGIMDNDLYRNVMEMVRTMQNQAGKDNPVVKYIVSAVFTKICSDKLNSFIDLNEENEEPK